jgi:hypothetical protein
VRVPQVVDLAGITNTVGCPVLRVLGEEPCLEPVEGAGVGNAGAKWVWRTFHIFWFVLLAAWCSVDEDV